MTLYDGDSSSLFAEKTSRNYEKKASLFLGESFPPNDICYTRTSAETVKNFPNRPNRVQFPLGVEASRNLLFYFISYYFEPPSSSMISVCSNGIQWSCDFGPDSLTLTVNDLTHDMTKSSEQNNVPNRNLLLCLRFFFGSPSSKGSNN